jgi:hypothetical protein
MFIFSAPAADFRVIREWIRARYWMVVSQLMRREVSDSK